MAPAGSGKTEVLIQRVIRTIEHSVGEAFRLLVVTFTVKAAEELKQRARAAVADELWRVDADTIHGFALDWLKRYGREIGIGPDVVVLSDDIDRVAVLAEYLRSIGLGDDLGSDGGSGLRRVIEAIDTHRTGHNGRHCACSSDYSHLGVSMQELADAYSAALQARGAVDFPGMLSNLMELFDEDPWVLEHFRTLYRCILVDEGQDLTRIQSALLRRLAGEDIDLFVVADDRQSIRGYAGGSFTHAQALVPSAAPDPLQLRHNFRCAQAIQRAAEAVLRPVGDTRHVALPENTPSGRVRFVPMTSPEAEAYWIAEWASGLLKTGLDPGVIADGEDPSLVPEDVAVAFRTRWVLAPIVDALAERGIRFVVQTDTAVFLPEPEARLFVDCLAFGVNANDAPAARRSIEELRDWTGDDLSGDPLQALRTIRNASLESVAELVTRCLRRGTDLEQAMEGVAELGKTHDWPRGARKISEVWRDYRTTSTVQGLSPQGFLAHLARTQRTRPTDPGVRLLTIDRAKGLEFKAVALVGVRDGLIPHYRANTPLERSEERRRLYVAMTRAARELVITWPTTTVDRYDRTHEQSPSPFLVEAGLLATVDPTT